MTLTCNFLFKVPFADWLDMVAKEKEATFGPWFGLANPAFINVLHWCTSDACRISKLLSCAKRCPEPGGSDAMLPSLSCHNLYSPMNSAGVTPLGDCSSYFHAEEWAFQHTFPCFFCVFLQAIHWFTAVPYSGLSKESGQRMGSTFSWVAHFLISYGSLKKPNANWGVSEVPANIVLASGPSLCSLTTLAMEN